MGQHKLKNKPKKQYKWIICTKWFDKKLKPTVLTEAERAGPKPPKKKLEFDYFPFWTPIGTHRVVCKRGTHAGIPRVYDSLQETEQELQSILNAAPQNVHLMFCALKVKYVPSKIKMYKQNWFDKYVIEERVLKVEDKSNKQQTFKGSEDI